MDYKEIEGYPNYLIYRDGRVWSKYYKRFLKFYLNINKETGRKHYHIRLYNDLGQKDFKRYKLLGMVFIPNPLNLPEIDHIDRNSLNDDLTNLRWATKKQNLENKGLYKNNKLGLKYIVEKKKKFIVQIVRLNYYKSFKTKEEAILQRNLFLESVGEDYLNIDT